MNTDYTVKTTKGTFALKRETFPAFGVSMRLPETLQDLSPEERQKRQLASGVAEVIKTDMKNKIAFTINSSPGEPQGDKTEDAFVNELILVQQNAISRLTPGYKEYELKCKIIDEHTIAYLSFKSNSLSDDIFNIFYMLIQKEKIISGTFSCLFPDHEEWRLVFLMCLDTIKFIHD
jgi:hypothetical protein